MNEKCIECGATMKRVKKAAHKAEGFGLSDVTLKNMEVLVCDQCDEEEEVFPNLSGILTEIANQLIRKKGRLLGEEIRFLRKHVGMTGERLAKFLGTDKTTVSKWENDADRIGDQSDRLFRLVVTLRASLGATERGALLEHLSEIRKSASEPAVIAIDLNTLRPSESAVLHFTAPSETALSVLEVTSKQLTNTALKTWQPSGLDRTEIVFTAVTDLANPAVLEESNEDILAAA